MASKKNELKKHVAYLEARRSGAEYVIGKTPKETLEFVTGLTKSIQDNNVVIANIEKNEKELKEAEHVEHIETSKQVRQL